MYSTVSGNLYPAVCKGGVAAALLALFGGQHPIRVDTQPSTHHPTRADRAKSRRTTRQGSTRSRRQNTKHPTSGQRRPPVAATQEPTQHPTRADKAPDRSRRAKEEGQRDKGRCSTRQESPDRSRHAKSAQHPTRADMRNLHNTRQEPIPHSHPTRVTRQEPTRAAAATRARRRQARWSFKTLLQASARWSLKTPPSPLRHTVVLSFVILIIHVTISSL